MYGSERYLTEIHLREISPIDIFLESLLPICLLFVLLSLISIIYPITSFGFKSRKNALVKSLIALTLFSITFYALTQTAPYMQNTGEPNRLAFKYKKIAAKNRAKDRAESRAKEKACRKDAVCYGNKAESFALFSCATRIEQLAPYAYEWTFRGRQNLFTEYVWLDQEAGSVTMIGYGIKFQDASGEWRRMRYECDVNAETERVLDARVKAAPAGAN